MRRVGHPAVVYSVEVWSAIGRLPQPEFALVQQAIAAKTAELIRHVDEAPVRFSLDAGAHRVICLFEPPKALFTVERLERVEEQPR